MEQVAEAAETVVDYDLTKANAAGSECLAAALDYLALGWSVLCLCPPDHVGVGKGHKGCDSPGKRPLADGGRWKDWQTERPSADRLREWWQQHPNANVGLALGPISGLVRLDTEGETSEERLRELSGGDLPDTLEFTSGRGRGRLYALPPGLEARTSVDGLSDGEVRIQGLGAQTVLPPSRHATGTRYEWVAGRGPHDISAAPAPAWLVERLQRGGSTTRPETGSLSEGELIVEGGRDTTLTSIAGTMRRRGLSEEAIYAALEVTNRDQCDPPLPDAQVRKIARSVARYEPDAYAGVTIKLPSAATANAAEGKSTDPADLFGTPIPASMLRLANEEAKWLWEGYLAQGSITLLSALWKAGKTTLLAHLLRTLESESMFCGKPVRPVRVLYITEEHESIWAGRVHSLGIRDHVEYLIRPFPAKPSYLEWSAFLKHVGDLCQQRAYDLVVLDTLSNLWPVKDENDASRVQEALMPLHRVSDTAAFLIVHHLRKSDGTEATGARGSGALSAFVDTLLELRRFNAGDRKDKRRVLSGYGRYQETPDEVVVELTDAGYVPQGDKGEAAYRDIAKVVETILPPREPGMSYAQIVEEWPNATVPTKKTLLDALRCGTESGRWCVTGEGVRGDPYYWFRPAPFVVAFPAE